MKKAFILAALSLAVFSSATNAFAYGYTVNGQHIDGYVRDARPDPVPGSGFSVENVAIPVSLPTFGNTRVIDLYNVLLPQDRAIFLQLIAHTHLVY